MKFVKNYVLTLGKSVLVIVMIAATCASCSKDKSDPPVPPAPSPVGLWTGKYGAANTLGLNYAILLNADGSMKSYVMSPDVTDTAAATTKGKGNWQQAGTQITTEYSTGAYQFTTTGNSNSSYTTMTGTWKSNTVFTGGFVLSKQ